MDDAREDRVIRRPQGRSNRDANLDREPRHGHYFVAWFELLPSSAGLWTPDKAQPGPQCAQCWQLVGTQWIPSDVRAPLKYGLVARPPQTSKSLQE